MNNKGVKQKWTNGEIKRLIRESKIAYLTQKINSSEENHQRFRQLFKRKKGETRKSKRLCEIELANSIKGSKNVFKYMRNNKKQKSSMRPLQKEEENITTDIEISEILNCSETLNVPDFNSSYRKKIEAPMTYFRINGEVIKPGFLCN